MKTLDHFKGLILQPGVMGAVLAYQQRFSVESVQAAQDLVKGRTFEIVASSPESPFQTGDLVVLRSATLAVEAIDEEVKEVAKYGIWELCRSSLPVFITAADILAKVDKESDHG